MQSPRSQEGERRSQRVPPCAAQAVFMNGIERTSIAVDIVGIGYAAFAAATGAALLEIDLVLIWRSHALAAQDEPAIEVETVDRLDW